MKNKKNDISKKPHLFEILHRVHSSVFKFIKSAFLSLALLGLIFLLVQNMEQTHTLLIAMLEEERLTLVLSFVLLSGLALLISHFPIYVYYSLGINQSEKYVNWDYVPMGKKFPFNRIPIFIYKIDGNKVFDKNGVDRRDYLVNTLRYALGIVIFGIWVYYIFNSFEQKLADDASFEHMKLILTLTCITILFFYTRLKRRQRFLLKIGDKKATDTYHLKITKFLFNCTLILGSALAILLFWGGFNYFSFLILMLITFLSVLNYVFFRLVRVHLNTIYGLLTDRKGSPFKLFVKSLKFFASPEGYLKAFGYTAMSCLILIIYVNLGSVLGWILPNALIILLAYFYFYYWTLATIAKYMFASQQVERCKARTKKRIGATILTIGILIFVSFFIEKNVHRLEQIPPDIDTELVVEDEFVEAIKNRPYDTLFFIASHGGGLKANAWTLEVLNSLQKETNGTLLDQTIALSGASGGSLGLALYTSLYKNHQKDFGSIDGKIENIVHGNYTSVDLSMTFGIDSYRKLFPLNYIDAIRDRPYYSMLRYQNYIEEKPSDRLLKTSFRKYWAELFKNETYFPSLIMNTAGSKGNRGILWSVKTDRFDDIFHFSENLAELNRDGKDAKQNQEKTLTYYEAVSTTNRFPIFSPAAKIEGYGHYMDAGAIDNSGLLSCLDLYAYLMAHPKKPLEGKKIVFLEIANGKTNYIDLVLNEFLENSELNRLTKKADESDNIKVNIETGLNLDKIPQYLNRMLGVMQQRDSAQFQHIAINMPRKISLKDVNDYISGSLDEQVSESVKDFLDDLNPKILDDTDCKKTFFQSWDYYEPTLSRHLSKSSHDYMKDILKNDHVSVKIDGIKKLVRKEEPALAVNR